jgi:hypothetical protein
MASCREPRVVLDCVERWLAGSRPCEDDVGACFVHYRLMGQLACTHRHTPSAALLLQRVCAWSEALWHRCQHRDVREEFRRWKVHWVRAGDEADLANQALQLENDDLKRRIRELEASAPAREQRRRLE